MLLLFWVGAVAERLPGLQAARLVGACSRRLRGGGGSIRPVPDGCRQLGTERPAARVQPHESRDVLRHVRHRPLDRPTQKSTQKGCAMSALQLKDHIVLVTGALGTLGSAMCKAIEAAGGKADPQRPGARAARSTSRWTSPGRRTGRRRWRRSAARTGASTASSTTPASARRATWSRRRSPSGAA